MTNPARQAAERIVPHQNMMPHVKELIDHAESVIQAAIDAATADIARERPAWHRRPTSPGWWVCFPDLNDERMAQLPNPSLLELSDDDLKRGAPFFCRCVYGPIPPEPPEMPT